MKQSNGIAGISSLVGLVILAVTLPFLSNLMQKPQDTRNLAVEEKEDCKTADVGEKYCTGGSGWKVCGKTDTGNCNSPMNCTDVSGGGIKCSCEGGISWGGKWCVGDKIAECGSDPAPTPKACSVGTCLGSAGSAYCGGSTTPVPEECPKGVAKGDRYCTGTRTWKQCGGDLKGTCVDYDCLNGYCGPATDGCKSNSDCPTGKVCKDKVCIAEKECRDKSGAIVREGQNYCTGAVDAGTWLTCGKTSGGTCPSDRPVCKYGATGAGAECIKKEETKPPALPKTDCIDGVNGKKIPAGTSGCKDSSTYARCVDGASNKWEKEEPCPLMCGKESRCIDCGKKDQLCCPGNVCDDATKLTCKNIGAPGPIGAVWMCKEKTDTPPEPPKTTDCKSDGGEIVTKNGEWGCKNNDEIAYCNDKGEWEKMRSCFGDCKSGLCGCKADELRKTSAKPKASTCVTGASRSYCNGKDGWQKVEFCPATAPDCLGGICVSPDRSKCVINLGRSYTDEYDIVGGDYNCDGKIDIRDYSVWRKEFVDRQKWNGSPNWWTDIDGNKDVDVNDSGFSRWRDVFLN